MTVVNQPIRFSGTPEEKKANFNTHLWETMDGIDYNCGYCDCKPWHAAAEYPCGVSPPRETVKYEGTQEEVIKQLAPRPKE